MDAEEKFVLISNLICEPSRARMLWNLLDGRAYTATELAVAADISSTSASNHLSKLLGADLLKVETQGRLAIIHSPVPKSLTLSKRWRIWRTAARRKKMP